LRSVERVAIVRNMLKPPGGFVEMLAAAYEHHDERGDVGRRGVLDAVVRCASIAPAIAWWRSPPPARLRLMGLVHAFDGDGRRSQIAST
jgi:hypothetical protein